ncbi:Kdo2-lipid IVA lauroyltransferase [Phycisphaerales bacterium]|nr:Kdo2-lipid IVA lauroyltransferase [Phycisphaerales bacterium]
MGKKKKHLPGWIEAPVAAVIRGAMTPPLLLGLEPALAAARALGEWYPRVQPRRFDRAVRNLRDAYPEWDEGRVRATAVGSYQHVFRLGVELLYTPRLITKEGFVRHLVLADVSPAMRALMAGRPVILITGHCGNWELIGYAMSMMGFPVHAVYRPLDLRPLDQWVRDTRQRRGLTLVNKFGAVRALPQVLKAGHPVGLVADQSGGDRGVFVPFFGRLTSTYKSVGMLALQTGAVMACGAARRMGEHDLPDTGPWQGAPWPRRHTRWGPGSLRYLVELTDIFGPEEYTNQPDPLYYITARYRRAIEAMVRRAPEQYFWMHRVWRSRPLHERTGKPFPDRWRERLAALPWMTDSDVAAVVDRSDRDKLDLKALQR